ncbi:MAG TPA: ATP-binding protein [Verrucomicrobiae bacterium]|jgi:signal transduction histidine kinase/CheY-like chemotaxis protein
MNALTNQETDRLAAQRVSELQTANDQLKKEIAEHIRLQSQLRQSHKMEAAGQLAAGVAHDFNNILTVVQGNASLLLASRTPGSPDYQPLRNICDASEKAAAMVSRLLTFCRQQTPDRRPVHLGDTLAAIAETMSGALTPKIKLEAHTAPSLPLINADEMMLETLLMNLASNARDAMPNGGILGIIAMPVRIGPSETSLNAEARPGDFVRLTVSDNGEGIPAEILPHIFEPFFTTKPHGQGGGLGLAAVYGIVKQHDGWVEVQSRVKHGTAVHVFLPVSAANESRPAVPAAAAPPPPPRRPAARETILVVDDEPDLRELVVQVLESGGYKVLSAGSGTEALEKWAKRPCDIQLLLTDLVMPDGLTGRKLADRLRVEDPRLRVIFTSGYTAGHSGTELADVKPHNFLAKPYRPAMLLQVVRECLNRPCEAPTVTKQAA